MEVQALMDILGVSAATLIKPYPSHRGS
jgi:hypothetical protein